MGMLVVNLNMRWGENGVQNRKYGNIMSEAVKDFTVCGKCSGCGSCCSDLLPVTDAEIKRILKYDGGDR